MRLQSILKITSFTGFFMRSNSEAALGTEYVLVLKLFFLSLIGKRTHSLRMQEVSGTEEDYNLK